LALIIASGSCRAAPGVENSRDLAKYCQELEKGRKGTGGRIRIPNTSAALLCWGYLQAFQDLSVLVDQDGRRVIGSCPPEQTTLLQLIHTFVVYAQAHPSDLPDNTAAAVIKALQEAFPCD
jgi:hypothetical protein